MAEEPTEQDYALIIQQPGKAEQTLAKFVKLLLSYHYGLSTEIISDSTRHALDCLKIGRPDLRRLKDELGSTVQSEVTALVKQCMG